MSIATPTRKRSKTFTKYKSRSGNQTYTVFCNDNGQITGCSCPGWIYQRKCWHTERATDLAIQQAERKYHF